MVLAFPLPSKAALGEDETSVQADRARLKASMKSARTAAYTVHEIKDPNGTVVREYASTGGTVFAVVWQGPFIPDLPKLFGPYTGPYLQAVRERGAARPRVRGPLKMNMPELVVHSGGYMRAYFGYAYVPDLVPQGMDIREILQ